MDAIEEVAVLFIGIFITMIPTLLILEDKGRGTRSDKSRGSSSG